jgi:hypothetical protein
MEATAMLLKNLNPIYLSRLFLVVRKKRQKLAKQLFDEPTIV